MSRAEAGAAGRRGGPTHGVDPGVAHEQPAGERPGGERPGGEARPAPEGERSPASGAEGEQERGRRWLRRALTGLTGVLAGALLAGSGLLGEGASTERPPAPSEPLELDRYCRHLYGQDAAAYQPDDLEGWSCSVWRNGVWGLEPLDLHAACRWQRGPDARLGHSRLAQRALACTL